MVRLENLRSRSSPRRTVELGSRFVLRQTRQAQRIDLGDHVPAHAVRANQRVDAILANRDVRETPLFHPPGPA